MCSTYIEYPKQIYAWIRYKEPPKLYWFGSTRLVNLKTTLKRDLRNWVLRFIFKLRTPYLIFFWFIHVQYNNIVFIDTFSSILSTLILDFSFRNYEILKSWYLNLRKEFLSCMIFMIFFRKLIIFFLIFITCDKLSLN